MAMRKCPKKAYFFDPRNISLGSLYDYMHRIRRMNPSVLIIVHNSDYVQLIRFDFNYA